MIDTASIFHNRTPNADRLLKAGFAATEQGYAGSFDLPQGQFLMDVVISPEGAVSVKVVDRENEEEYVLVHAPGASGVFVGSVIQACEDRLREIAQNCFEYEVFRSTQAKELIRYVDRIYGDRLEFLWKKFPDNAVFRRGDTGKWYAVILTISRAKLGPAEAGTVEILDLRGQPEEIAALVDGRTYFPGYHMNKTHWYTICLDGSVPTQELCERVHASYLLAEKRR